MHQLPTGEAQLCFNARVTLLRQCFRDHLIEWLSLSVPDLWFETSLTVWPGMTTLLAIFGGFPLFHIALIILSSLITELVYSNIVAW